MRTLITKLMVILTILCFMAAPVWVWADPSELNAHIKQFGPLNDAEIVQEDGADNLNFATIHQNSVDAITEEGQDGNDAFIDQSGVNNNEEMSTADIDQIGRDNDAAIVQGHDDMGEPSGGHDNIGVIFQEGTSNLAKVDQAGSFNDGYVHQFGSGNQGQVLQPGDGNFGAVYQGGEEAVESIDNQAIVFQPGNDNTGTISQIEGPNHWAEVNQSGDGNTGHITQEGVNVEGNGCDVEPCEPSPFPSEGGNHAKIWQHPDPDHNGPGEEDLPTGNDNFADIFQDGSGNQALVDQNGNENDAVIDQEGVLNRASIKQVNGGTKEEVVSGNFAKIDQLGDRNEANILQTQNGHDNNVPDFDFEPATINQLMGDDNKASITQTDSNSQVASITQQNGNDNKALIFQRDGDNLLPNQNAPHQASILQDGDNNEAVILQKGELEIEDFGPMHVADIMQFGISNQAWIVQGTNSMADPPTRTAYTADIFQEGDFNRAIIRQGDMPENPHNFDIDEPMDPMEMAEFMDIPPPLFPWRIGEVSMEH